MLDCGIRIMDCIPSECYELNERIAIMKYDGKSIRPESGAIKDTCGKCKSRGNNSGRFIMSEVSKGGV